MKRKSNWPKSSMLPNVRTRCFVRRSRLAVCQAYRSQDIQRSLRQPRSQLSAPATRAVHRRRRDDDQQKASLDEALQRRLTLHLHLEIPEPPERERLWKSMLPQNAPWAKDINWKAPPKTTRFRRLHQNAVLRAAFLAADANTPINMTLLRRSASLEMEDMGRLIARGGRASVSGVPSLISAVRRENSDGPGPA